MTDFGREMSCTTGIRSGRFVSGARLVGEACFRRLTTPRSMLRGGEDEANYGLDLTELIGATDTVSQAAALPGKIEGELKKDERIVSVSATVVRTVDGPVTSYEISVDAVTDFGPFSLQIAASEVTVELLGLNA